MLDYCPKRGETKQQTQSARKTRNKNPRTSHKRTNNRRGTNHQATRHNVGKTRAYTRPYSTVLFPQYQSRDSNPHAQPGNRF